jgi:hypothetical protein
MFFSFHSQADWDVPESWVTVYLSRILSLLQRLTANRSSLERLATQKESRAGCCRSSAESNAAATILYQAEGSSFEQAERLWRSWKELSWIWRSHWWKDVEPGRRGWAFNMS